MRMTTVSKKQWNRLKLRGIIFVIGQKILGFQESFYLSDIKNKTQEPKEVQQVQQIDTGFTSLHTQSLFGMKPENSIGNMVDLN